jgi:transposase
VAGDPSARLHPKKRSVGASERDEAARAAWRTQLSQVDVHRLVFVDESGTHTSLARLFAWAMRGQRATARVPRNHGKNTTLVAALAWDGIQAPWAVEGAMDGAAFAVYVRDVLAPTLRSGQLVVLDNLSVHKAPALQALIAARGCQLLFLPAYSPDLNPIEQAFSKLKAHLRRLAARTREALLDALALALDTITPEDAHGWFRHSGYPLLAQSP